MKRPLALIGLTLMSALTVFLYFLGDFVFWIAVGSIVCFVLSLAIAKLREQKEIAVFFATVCIAAVVFSVFTQTCVTPLTEKYGDTEATYTGVLADEGKFEYGYYRHKVNVTEVDGKTVNFNIRLNSKVPVMCDVYDKISFKALAQVSDSGSDFADKIFVEAYVYNEEDIKTERAVSKPWYSFIVPLRRYIKSALYLELDKDVAPLSTALVLGDTSGIDSETRDNFREAGMSHITVVSGMHFAIITLLFDKFIGRFIKNKYVNAGLTFLIILFFLALTGFGKSSIRASIMLFILILSHLFYREHDSYTSLGIAAMVLCLSNPYVVCDVGVLLSFSATLGIVGISKSLENQIYSVVIKGRRSKFALLNKAVKSMITVFCTTFAAVVATLPVTVFFFGRVSMVQIISNILVVPIIPAFMLFSMVCAASHYIFFFPYIADLCAVLANMFGSWTLWIAKIFSELPFASANAEHIGAYLWIGGTALIFVTAHVVKKSKGTVIICSILSVLILIGGMLGYYLNYKNICTVKVLFSKSEASIILDSADGNAVISCTSDRNGSLRLIRELENMSSKGKLLVVTTDKEYAENNAKDIADLFDYDNILMYDTDSEVFSNDTAWQKDKNLIAIGSEYTADLWSKAELRVFMYRSEVYEYLEIGDKTILVLPSLGDCAHIPRDMRSPDILITSGMIYSMELLEFDTLIASGDSFESSAVISCYHQRPAQKIAVNKTISFDIKS